jgi:hypothetical protein
MRIPVLIFLTTLTVVGTAAAQIELVSDNYFPSEFEFKELQPVSPEETFSDPARLSKIPDGMLISAVGFEKYARKSYSAGGANTLSVEIIKLKDSRAAYSLLTLLRDSDIHLGPPGDGFVSDSNGIRFAQRRFWVNIQGNGVPEDLFKRVAVSVSNKIGPRQQKPPALVSHFPKSGYDFSSLKYFPEIKSFEYYFKQVPEWMYGCKPEMEIARANYSMGNAAGVLSLLSFPNSEMAEECYGNLSTPTGSGKNGKNIYGKKVGPLLGVLEGQFDPHSANKILDSLQYSYSVRWVYEKPQPKTVWGVPVGILETVVKSFLFVAVLCGVSLLAGVAFALVRFRWRQRASKHSMDNESEITSLRMR